MGVNKELGSMADDKTKTGRIDRARINVNEEYELRDWSAKLGVTSWEVKAAVRKVGPIAKDVARALGSNARL
jgi:hypothetical protein